MQGLRTKRRQDLSDVSMSSVSAEVQEGHRLIRKRVGGRAGLRLSAERLEPKLIIIQTLESSERMQTVKES